MRAVPELELLLAPFVIIGLVVYGIGWVVAGLCHGVAWLRLAARQRHEVELARQQAAMQLRMQQLAGELNASALQARVALIRESQLAASQNARRQ